MADKLTYELIVSFKSDRCGCTNLICNLFEQLGIAIQEITESQRQGMTYLSVYSKDSIRTQKLCRSIKKLNLKNVDVRTQQIKTKDWQTAWHKDFKPFQLTKLFEVVPIWYKEKHKVPKKRIPIYIDTTIAFGTGLHATTRFMSELIESKRNRLSEFLDVGTGTGILSIIAHHCGAEKQRAIDLNNGIIKIAKANAKINDCHSIRFGILTLEDLSLKEKYDFIAANLVTDVLIKNKKKLLKLLKKDGYLAVSGISMNNYELFRKEFKSLPLRCTRVKKEEGWTACLFKKQPTLKGG